MARIRSASIGSFSGKLGDVVFRHQNGKVVVANRPGSFMPGTDPASVGRRQTFALATKFSKCAYSVPALKGLWTASSPKGSNPFNLIVRQNLAALRSGKPDSQSVTPAEGFPAKIKTIASDDNPLRLSFEPLGQTTGIDLSSEKYIQLTGVLSVTTPNIKERQDFSFFPVFSDPCVLSLDSELTFSINLPKDASALSSGSPERKVHIALLTLDANYHSVNCTGTMVIKI
jgi:hypothetical protein